MKLKEGRSSTLGVGKSVVKRQILEKPNLHYEEIYFR